MEDFCAVCGTTLYDDVRCPKCGADLPVSDDCAYHAPSAFVAEKREQREMRRRRDNTLKAQSAQEREAREREAKRAARLESSHREFVLALKTAARAGR